MFTRMYVCILYLHMYTYVYRYIYLQYFFLCMFMGPKNVFLVFFLVSTFFCNFIPAGMFLYTCMFVHSYIDLHVSSFLFVFRLVSVCIYVLYVCLYVYLQVSHTSVCVCVHLNQL
jgi:hypothetical protein